MIIKDLDDMCVIKWRLTDACNYKCSYCIRRPLVLKQHNINDDFKLCEEAMPDIIRIATELSKINNKKVKLDLIGGEISAYNNLNEFIDKLYSCDAITKINITTNFSRPKEYYLELINTAKKHDKILSITASYHFEHTTLDEFMPKAKACHEAIDKWFKCETVITNGNNDIDKFIEECNKIGCRYMCEEDLFDPTKRGQSVKNYKIGNRYQVILDDGTEKLFTTRNEVIKTYGDDGIAINTTNHQCTRDKDYVYIEQNIAIPCRQSMPISEYHVNENLRDCLVGHCTLCGHMSIYKKENV